MEDLGVVGRMLLNWILRKKCVKMWTGWNSSECDATIGFCKHDDELSDSVETLNLLTRWILPRKPTYATHHMNLKTNSKIPGNTKSSEATSHLRPKSVREGITSVNSGIKTLTLSEANILHQFLEAWVKTAKSNIPR
jgi:hypothetical protein